MNGTCQTSYEALPRAAICSTVDETKVTCVQKELALVLNKSIPFKSLLARESFFNKEIRPRAGMASKENWPETFTLFHGTTAISTSGF